MAVDFGKITLREFESNAAVPLGTYADDDLVKRFQIHGNALLSSVYVKSISGGGSLNVQYYTTTTDANGGEKDYLEGHDLITALNSPAIKPYKALINRFHQNVYLEVTVVGTVQFSVFTTIIADMALDINEAAVVNIANTLDNERTALNTSNAVEVLPAGFLHQIGIMLRNSNETAILKLGATKAKAEGAGGFQLNPGEILPIDISEDANVWAISNEAGAYVHWFRAARV